MRKQWFLLIKVQKSMKNHTVFAVKCIQLPPYNLLWIVLGVSVVKKWEKNDFFWWKYKKYEKSHCFHHEMYIATSL